MRPWLSRRSLGASCLQESLPPSLTWAMGFAGTSRWRRRLECRRAWEEGAGYKVIEPGAWCLASLCRMGQPYREYPVRLPCRFAAYSRHIYWKPVVISAAFKSFFGIAMLKPLFSIPTF